MKPFTQHFAGIDCHVKQFEFGLNLMVSAVQAERERKKERERKRACVNACV
jgi:hypothetical protein